MINMQKPVKSPVNSAESVQKLKKEFKSSADDEKFDRNYIESLQKSESKEAHKTIRQYQVLITLIKIASKLTFAYNLKNVLQYLQLAGLSTIIGFFT